MSIYDKRRQLIDASNRRNGKGFLARSLKEIGMWLGVQEHTLIKCYIAEHTREIRETATWGTSGRVRFRDGRIVHIRVVGEKIVETEEDSHLRF